MEYEKLVLISFMTARLVLHDVLSFRVFEKYGGTSPVTFATWFLYGLPISAIMFVLAWVWLQIFFLRG